MIATSHKVSLDRERVAETISALNLDRVAWQLRHPSHGEAPTEAQVAEMVERYKQWLFLVAVRPEKLVPTVDIDDVWHLHVLDTSRYMKDCDVIFGGYLHHTPVLPFDCTDCDEMTRQAYLAETTRAWKEEFGSEPESRYAFCDVRRIRSSGASVRSQNCSGWC